MTRLPQSLLLAGLSAALLSTPAVAQKKTAAAPANSTMESDRPLLGGELGFATNSFDFMVGAQFAYKVAKAIDIYPTVQLYFPSDASAWSLNANVRYWPNLNMPNSGLYAGGGLGFTHVSANNCNVSGCSDTKVGLNLLGGWQFKTSSGLLPFAELRAVLASDVDRIEFVGGINFKL